MDARAAVVLLCAILWRKSTASPLHPGDSCLLDDIPVAPNFNFSQVAGVWHITERTTFIWGEATWTSQMYNFVQGHDGTRVLVISGYNPVKSTCVDPIVNLLESTSTAGSFRDSQDDTAMISKVVAVTDSVAVFYICLKTEDGGTCPAHQRIVSFASRDLSMSKADRQSLVEHLSDLCIGVEDLHSSPQGQCQIPQTDESSVSSSLFDGTTSVLSISVAKQSVMTLTCSITRPQLVTKVSWHKVSDTGVRKLTAGDTRVVDDSRISVIRPYLKDWNLRIINFGTVESDGSVYVCMNDKQEIRKYLVSIVEPPHIEASSDSLTVATGDNVTLECDISGIPPPTVSWYTKKNNAHQHRRCGDAQVDLVFILEASSEFGVYNFNLALDFVRFYLVYSDINGGNVRVGFMTFNHEARVEFQMSDYHDKKQLYLALLRLQHRGGSANISNAIHVARTQMFLPRHGNRKHVGDAIILMTVGRVNDDASHILSEASAAKNSGIHMYVVQSSLDHTAEVGAIASTPVEQNQFSLAQFQQLKELRNSMFRSHCPGPSSEGGHSLTFISVTKDNIGQYVCLAHNGILPDSSHTFYLDVNFSPEVSVNAEEVRKAIGQSMTLECEVKANPSSPIQWEHMGTFIRNDNRHKLTRQKDDDTTSALTLHVDQLEQEDFGKYTCVAENTLGTGRASVQLTEITPSQCAEARTRVQEELNVSGILGDWQRVKVISYLYGNKTYISETVKYFINTDGHLSTAYRGKTKNADACADPGVHVLVEEEQPGKYFSANRELLQFVYTDYTNAVLYMCREVDDSGHCQKENLHVEITTKKFPVPVEKMAELEQIVSDLCVDVEDMIETTPGLCAFPEDFLESVGYADDDAATSHCDQARSHVQEDFNVYDFLGKWHRVKVTPYFYGNQTYKSWTMQFFINAGGSLSSAFISQNNDACSDPGVFLLELESRGKYIHSYQEYREQFQFVYTDYTNAVLYMCREVDDSGHCQKENVHVEIITKNFPVPVEKMAELEQIVSDLCVDVEDMIDGTPGHCDFPEGFLDSVGYDTNGVNQDYLCQVERRRVQTNFNASQTDISTLVPPSPQQLSHPQTPHRTSPQPATVHPYTSISTLPPTLPPETSALYHTAPPPTTQANTNTSVEDRLNASEVNTNDSLLVPPPPQPPPFLHPHPQISTFETITITLPPPPDHSLRSTLSSSDNINTSTLSPPPDPALRSTLSSSDINTSTLPPPPDPALRSPLSSSDISTSTLSPPDPQLPPSPPMSSTDMTNTSTLTLPPPPPPHPPVLPSELASSSDNTSSLPSQPDPPFVSSPSQPSHNTSTSNNLHQQTEVTHPPYIPQPYTPQPYIQQPDVNQSTTTPSSTLPPPPPQPPHPPRLRPSSSDTIPGPDTPLLPQAPASQPLPYLPQSDVSPAYLCEVARAQLQPDFNSSQFIGEWQVIKTTTFRGHRETFISETINYFLSTTGHLVLAFSGMNPESENCLPPNHLELTQDQPGHYTTHINNMSASVQIVYTDYNYAVTLSCSSISDNGQCPQQHMSVQIIARQNPIPDNIMHNLEHYAAALCISVEDMRDNVPDLCEIPVDYLVSAGYHSEEMCKLEKMPIQKNFDKNRFLGMWNIIKTSPNYFGGKVYLTAVQDYFLKDDGAFTTAYRGYMQGSSTCLRPGTILFEKDSHGDYIFRTLTGQGTFKIIYTDYNYAVTYSCRQVGNDGWCLDGLAHTSILARDDIIDPDTMKLLESYVQRTCVDLNTMVYVDTDLCSIPLEYLETVGHSGPDRCQVPNIPIQADFDLTQFLGKWNTLKILPYYYGERTYRSMTHKYFLNGEDKLTLVFKGYNQTSHQCTQSRHVTMKQRSPGYFVLPDNATYRVVYTDYEYAILYICGSLQTDGHCLKQKTQVAIMSRHNSIPDELLQRLLGDISSLCVDVSDLMDVNPGVCLISAEELDKAGYSGPPEDECQLSGISYQENINTTMLQGEWYTVMSTPSVSHLVESLGPAYFHFDGWHLVRLYRGIDEKSGLCNPTEAVSLREVTAAGEYYHHMDSNSFTFRILHTCPKYMVIYTCPEEGEDGSCVHPWVNILARSRVIPDNHLPGLKKYVTHACVDSNTLVNNKKLECPVPPAIVEAAQNDLITDDHSVIGCHSDFVPVQADLDIHKFADTTWFTLWRSSSMWGNTSLVPSSRKQIVLAPVEDESDDVFLLSRSFKSSWDFCEPVEVLKLTEFEQPGDYTISFGDSSSLHGMYRIMYSDDEYAVTYSCFDATMGESCPSDSRLVEILSVHTTVDEQHLQTLLSYVNNVCADVSTMAQTDPGACSISQTIVNAVRGHQVTTDYALPIAGCNGNLITVDPNFDLTTFIGEWNLVYSTNYMKWQTEGASLALHIAETDGGILILRKYYSPVSGQCVPTEAGSLVERSGAGDYAGFFTDGPVMMKVIHLEDRLAVTYICLLMEEDGTCGRDSLSINFLSRSEDITEEELERLKEYAYWTCAEMDDVIKMKTGLCEIPSKIRTAAVLGEITADFSVVECSMDFIQTQDVTLDQLQGFWNNIMKTEYFLGVERNAREYGYITPYGDGNQGVYISNSYNQSQCSLTQSLKLTWESEGTFSYVFETFTGKMKILYLDDVVGVFYYCLQPKEDGTCRDGFSSFEILSRETSIPAEKLDRLKKRDSDVCEKVGDRVWPPSPCTIPVELQQAGRSGELTQDYVVAACITKFIPVQDNFDFQRFSGSWHTIAKTQHIWGNRSWASELRDFHVSQDGRLMCYYRGYDKEVHGCRPTEFIQLTDTSTPGHFTYRFRNMEATLKVIYTDYTNAVVYWCLGTKPDGTCEDNKIQVEIISKNLRVDRETRAKMENYIRHGCVHLHDMQDSDLDLCQIPSSIRQAALAGRISSDYIKVQCMDEFINVQRNFDMNRFSGDWYTVATTHFVWGSNTWDNFRRRIQILDDGSYVMAYTGYRTYAASCARAASVELTQRGQPGQFVFFNGEKEVTMRVVYTDYEVAVLYTCYSLGTDGICQRNKLHVEVLSREKGIEEATMTSMYFYVSNLCVEIDDLVVSNYDLCEAPEVDEDSIQRKVCTFDDIPLTRNFVFLQMAGLWYEVARTRFTFNKMESSVLFYRYQNGHLDGLYTGSMKGFCQDPLSSLTKLHSRNEPDAYLLGRLGGKDSVYPWFSFKIIHFDGQYLMYYACYTTSDDGTCPRDKMEVTLLGREQGLSDEIKSKIPDLMRGVCLKPADLVTSKASVDCTSYLFPDSHNSPAGDDENKKCSLLAEMAVAEDIEDQNLVGKWHSAVDVGFGMEGKSHSFNVTIRRHTDKTFKMEVEQGDDDNHFTNYSVMLKPRCDSFSHGDYISTLGSTVMGQWSSLKVLHNDGNTMLLYWCLKEQSDGTCLSSGIRVLLLVRNLPLQETIKQNLLGKIQDVCFTPPPPTPVLYGVIPGAAFGLRARKPVENQTDFLTPSIFTSFCAIDNIPTINISQELHAGLWYEIARTPDPMLTMDATIGYYLPVAGGHMKMIYSGRTPDGQCKGPMFGDLRPRCPDNIDGNYQGRIKMPRMWLWTSWKVLYTDYDQAMLALSCMDEDDNGLCTPMGTKMHIMSRNHTLSADLRNKLNLLVQSACVDPSSLKDTKHDDSCRGNVEAAVEQLKAEQRRR